MAGGFNAVIDKAAAAGKFDFWPSASLRDWLAFVAAWATMAVGSIAQQDVFQRVTSAKDEKTAMRGTLLGGGFYLIFAFVPMFIAVSALLIDPAKVQATLAADGTDFQLVLPQLILDRTPLFAQVMFFGALLSAILSTASGALLAPTAVLTENVIKPLVGARISDQQALRLLRVILVLFTIGVTMFALLSESSMYQMVQNAYKVTLVAAFTPLAFGMFWTRATPQGALLSIIFGLVGWILAELLAPRGAAAAAVRRAWRGDDRHGGRLAAADGDRRPGPSGNRGRRRRAGRTSACSQQMEILAVAVQPPEHRTAAAPGVASASSRTVRSSPAASMRRIGAVVAEQPRRAPPRARRVASVERRLAPSTAPPADPDRLLPGQP